MSLYPARAAGDSGHISDHNLIDTKFDSVDTSISTLTTALSTQGTTITTLAGQIGGFASLQTVGSTPLTVSGTVVLKRHNRFSAASGAVTATLPTGAAEGTEVSIEKTDGSTNPVNVTGSIRGNASTITLVWAQETLLLRADSTGSWYPISSHKTKTSLDAAYTAPSADNVVDSATKVMMTAAERANLSSLVSTGNPDQSSDPFWIPATMFTRDANGGTVSVVKATGSNYALPQFVGTATGAVTMALPGLFIPSSWTQFRVRIVVLPNSAQTTNLNVYMGAAWTEFASNAATIPTAAPTASSGYSMVTASWPNGTYGAAEIVTGPFAHSASSPIGTLYICRDKTAGTPDTSGTSAYLYAVGIERVA